jgi:hypothetical protein
VFIKYKMDASSVGRATTSAALWAGIAYGLAMAGGVQVSMTDLAIDAAIMGGSSVGADLLHNMAGANPTGITSAVATGAMYAGLSKVVRGSDAYAVNFVGAAGLDMVVEKYYEMMA